MACIHGKNPVRIDQINCNDCDKTLYKPDIFHSTTIDKINIVSDKTDNVNANFSTNQNQNMLITVKNGNVTFLSFWHKR